MRLLHTSDWHLGKVTYGVSRRPDHESVHAEIVAIARDFRPDLMVHTGDLFDASMPAVEEMRQGIDMLDEFAAIAPVVVLCGNHENPKLFALFDRLRGSPRLRFIDKPRAPSDGGILNFSARDGAERIRLASVPFVRNTTYLDAFGAPGSWAADYGDNLAYVERVFAAALIPEDPARDISIFAAHLHVTGAVLAHSERTVHIDDFGTRAEAIPAVTYAAFGHIHKPQEIGGRAWARYAGSPIAIDFGEGDDQKSVVLVEASPGTNARIEVAPLSGGRALRRARGTLEALRAQALALRGALALVTVEEPNVVGLFERVCEALPETIVLRVDSLDPHRHVEALENDDDTPEPELTKLFGGYLAEHGAADADNGRIVELFETATRALRSGEAMTLADLLPVTAR